MTTRMHHRQPAVAGTFYPAEASGLLEAIRASFDDSVRPDPNAHVPKAVIAPHAGYVYSGPVAAGVFRRLVPGRGRISRVVVLGPSHRVYLRGLAVPSAVAFETPLGSIPIDDELRRAVLRLPAVVLDDEPHRLEHSLEVELPFLQAVLGEFSLLPIAVGDAGTAEVANVLDAVWGGPETLIVVSTDLSHYLPYDEAVELDTATADRIVAADHAAIGDRDACGARPLRGLLRSAAMRGLHVEQIDLRNSGDTAGDRHRVVGYGAFAVG